MSPRRIEQLLDELWLSAHSHVLEVGCGRGELIRMILGKFGCKAAGVDPDGEALHAAAAKLTEYKNDVTLHQCRFDEIEFSENQFDATFSIGVTHAFGAVGEALDNALRSLSRITKPGGVILIGDGYWRTEPDPSYLEAADLQKKELRSHTENIKSGEKIGLDCIYTARASYEEWDHFEGAFWMAAERELALHPNHPETRRTAERRRTWKRAYLEWGRATMGFGLYLFLKPPTRMD